MIGRIFRYSDITNPVEERCDVVVVGSGAGGGVCAAELAEAGFDVVLLEEGGYYQTKDFSTSPLEGAKKLYRNAGTVAVLGRPPVMFSEGRCVGGSTTVNGGMCWRTPDKILKRWEWEHGLQGFQPRELEPFFDRVEERISVKEQDPESVGIDSHLFEEAAIRLGWRVTRNRRNQVRCVGTNNCALGCTSGGKMSTLVSYIPRAVQFGTRVYANCRVDKVWIENGQAVGVKGTFVDSDGIRSFPANIRADVVISSAGASQTPALLFRSGLWRKNRNIGKNLMLHPNVKTIGIFDQDISAWKGVHQNFQVHEFFDEGLIMATGMVPPNIVSTGLDAGPRATAELMQNFNKMLVIAALIEDTGVGRIYPGPGGRAFMTYSINDHDVQVALRGAALCAQAQFEAGAKKVYLPFSSLSEINSPDEIHKIFTHKPKPSEIELFSVHIMGTCRMANSAKDGVIDPFGESHTIRNLFVADASVFPTSIGLNPMETIMALATRTSAYLIENSQKFLMRKRPSTRRLAVV